jgi:acetylglutamate kinase
MKVVVKLGGAALDNKEIVQKFATSIASLASHGHKVVVVHGGGAALTRTLKELGRKSEFINGLRVTDSETRDVAVMVLAGHLNKQLVAAIGRTGQPALGLCGGDLQCMRASKRRGEVDLGFVGDICRVEPKWFEALWQHGAIPVIASIALGSDGEYYNVNADSMASAVAVACRANALVFLTDVPGVKGADGMVMKWLHLGDISGMVAQAAISGGMIPKLEACTLALKQGVNRVRIMPAANVEVLPGFFSQSIEYGTEVLQ